MNTPMADLLVEFERHFEHSVALWAEAMRTGETQAIEATIPPEITCYFGMAGQEQLNVIDRDGIVAGLRDSVAALQGCQKRFENRVVRLRSADEAVIFYEQVIEQQGKVLARLFSIESYRRSGGQWRCIREVTEHVGA